MASVHIIYGISSPGVLGVSHDQLIKGNLKIDKVKDKGAILKMIQQGCAKGFINEVNAVAEFAFVK